MGLSLGAHYRFIVRNKVGEQVDATKITLRYVREKMASDGSVTQASSTTAAGTDQALADDEYEQLGSAVDNTTDKYTSLHGTIECSFEGETGPDGTVPVWLQKSADGTNWPSMGEGFLIGVAKFSGETGTDADRSGQVDY